MKKIIRLTENDLHHIITNVVNRVLKEDMDYENYISDIIHARRIDDASIEFKNSTYDECEMNVIGRSGQEYHLFLSVNGNYSEGRKSFDYDVPDDEPETDYEITDIKISKYDENTNSYIDVPLKGDIYQLTKVLKPHIHVNWSNYSPYNDYYE